MVTSIHPDFVYWQLTNSLYQGSDMSKVGAQRFGEQRVKRVVVWEGLPACLEEILLLGLAAVGCL